MAVEAWEVIVIAVIIILLLKPSIISNVARSLGRMFGEFKKGKSEITPKAQIRCLRFCP